MQDKGLNCNYVVAKRPDNLPTSERAVPVAIFSTEPAVARTFLRKWCGDVRAGVLKAPRRWSAMLATCGVCDGQV